MSDARFSPDFQDATSVPALWDAARWFFRQLTGLCGTPCALVAEGFLPRKERRGILRWLRPVEGLVRRLLVAEAARLAETLPPAEARPRGPAASKRTKMKKYAERTRSHGAPFPDPENSAAWKVRISLFGPPEPALNPSFGPRLRVLDFDDDARIFAPAALKHAAEAHHARMRQTEEIPAPGRMFRRRFRPGPGSPWPLARRIEAVRRVLDHPEAYARRLARRLHKHAQRLTAACRPPPPSPPGKWPLPGETCLYYASKQAIAALRPLSGISDQESEGTA